MTDSSRSLLTAIKLEILRFACASLFGMRTKKLTKEQIIKSLNQKQAHKIFQSLSL